jgi:hypothetical protein
MLPLVQTMDQLYLTLRQWLSEHRVEPRMEHLSQMQQSRCFFSHRAAPLIRQRSLPLSPPCGYESPHPVQLRAYLGAFLP